MTHIEQLIKDLCPNGVPYKTFAELGTFYGGLSGKSKSDFQDGNAKYITYLNIGNNPALRLDILETVKVGPNEKQNDVRYGDALFTGSSETPDECAMSSVLTEHPTEKIYLNSFCFGFRFNSLDGICPAFYKHYFRSTQFRQAVRRTANGTTRFNVSKKEFAKLSIPIPPMEIQERIVALLDRYSALAAELQAELQLRRKQYEHYRTRLLTPHSESNSADNTDDCNWDWKTLGEICDVQDYVANGSFGDIKKNVQYYSEPNYALLVRITDLTNNFQNAQKVYIDEHAYNYMTKSRLEGGEIIISNVGSCGATFLCPKLDMPMSLAPNAILVRTPNNHFYYHWFCSKFGQEAISKIVAKSAMPKFNKTEFRKIRLPFPPEEEQKRIAYILDQFEKLLTSMEEGIPAEQAAQQKRYEYFRDLLLTFDRKQV